MLKLKTAASSLNQCLLFVFNTIYTDGMPFIVIRINKRMFIQNKYTKCYYNIINNSRHRELVGYKEKHHIIPKSLGGADDISNLATLTAREHFVCHLLLTKMTTGLAKRSMWHALWNIVNQKRNYQERYVVTSRTYEKIRVSNASALSDANTGKPSGRKGKPCTWGNKISATLKGFKPTAERNAKVSVALTGKKRPPRSVERQKNAKLAIANNRKDCEKCGRNITSSAYTRWHGSRCKW